MFLREPDALIAPVRFDERCALKVHGIQLSEMEAAAKLSSQPVPSLA
jgi:hypothetical protein